MSELSLTQLRRKLELKRKLKAFDLKGDFYEFFLWAWPIVVPTDFEAAPYHRYLCNELQALGEDVINRRDVVEKEYDLIVNVPPASGKSTIIQIIFPIWLWINDPSIKVISASNSASLGREHAEKSRDIVTNDKFAKMFPNVRLKADSKDKSNTKTTEGGQRYVTSVGGSVIGIHADLILIDDPQAVDDADSDTKRVTANEFITATLFSRKRDRKKCPTILIQQRLHELDATGHCLEKWGRVRHIKLPAERKNGVKPKVAEFLYDANGLLDPNRNDFKSLAEAKKTLGSYAYSGQYEQNPAPSDGGIWKKAWFPVIEWADFVERVDSPVWDFAADTAYTKKETNDPSGVLAYCIDGGNIYIRHADCQHLEFPELCKWFGRYVKLHGYDDRSRAYVEPKASGKSLVQMLSKYSGLNVIEDTPPTTDKEVRARASSATIEAGRVILVKGGSPSDEWMDPFLHQVSVFPNGKNDEFVDITNIAVNKLDGFTGEVLACGWD